VEVWASPKPKISLDSAGSVGKHLCGAATDYALRASIKAALASAAGARGPEAARGPLSAAAAARGRYRCCSSGLPWLLPCPLLPCIFFPVWLEGLCGQGGDEGSRAES
jgi:hypothetical protein